MFSDGFLGYPCVFTCAFARCCKVVFLLPYSNGEPMKTGGYVDGFSNWRDHIFISLLISSNCFDILVGHKWYCGCFFLYIQGHLS